MMFEQSWVATVGHLRWEEDREQTRQSWHVCLMALCHGRACLLSNSSDTYREFLILSMKSRMEGFELVGNMGLLVPLVFAHFLFMMLLGVAHGRSKNENGTPVGQPCEVVVSAHKFPGWFVVLDVCALWIRIINAIDILVVLSDHNALIVLENSK